MRAVTRWRSVLLVGGLVPVLAACDSMACTTIGCESAVSVGLSKIGTRYGSLPASATLCVNGNCQTQTVRLDGSAITPFVDQRLPAVTASPASPTVGVTFTLERAGKVLVDSHADATLTKFAPNGEACAPVCYTVQLFLVGSHLVPASAATR